MLGFKSGESAMTQTESTLEYRMNILVSPYLKSSCGFFCTKDIFFVTCIKYFNVFHKILQLLPVTRWNLFGKLLFLHPALNYFKRFSFFGSCIKIRMVYMYLYLLLKPVRKAISCSYNWFFGKQLTSEARNKNTFYPQNKYRNSIFRPLLCRYTSTKWL